MAAQVIAVINCNLQGLPGGDPTNVENGSATAATDGSCNVFVAPQAGTGGFLTVDQIASTILALVSNGPATVIVSQGQGTVNQAVSQ